MIYRNKTEETKSSCHIKLNKKNKNLIENPVDGSNKFNKHFESIETNNANRINLSRNIKNYTHLTTLTINNFFSCNQSA